MKQDYLNQLDGLPVGDRIEIEKEKAQSYRNNANFLFRLKAKKFTVKADGNKAYAIRIR